jgi:hypothetical protein
MPRPATGKTPVRNLRVADDIWLPALAKAVAEGRTLTDVIEGSLRRYNAKAVPPDHQFKFANWPDVSPWLDERMGAFNALDGEISDVLGRDDPEYLAVATWLAVTRHPSDTSQQQRVLTGFLLSPALDDTKGAWRNRYRDSRHLAEVILEVLGRHLPLL